MSNLAEMQQRAWNEAKQQARKVLIDEARNKRGFISYSELVSRVTALHLDAHDLRLGQLLGEISTEEHFKGRGLLTVLVVHKTGDQLPGKQFFELAKSLGRDVGEQLAFWISEHSKVCDYWKNNPTEV